MTDEEIAEELILQEQETAPDRMVKSNELQSHLEGIPEAIHTFHSRNFSELSSRIGGFESGEVVIISGWSGHGKTLLMQTLMNDFYTQGIMTSAFSYEVTPRQFLQRFGSAMPIFATPLQTRGNNITWLKEKILEGKSMFGSSIVFIDHLHYIISMAGNANKSDMIGEIMREIKVFAIKNDLVIFLIAHTLKPSSNDTLQLGSVRDSSFIEQESDTVLYVFRADQDEPNVENVSFVKIAKDRKNGTFNKIIKLMKIGNYLFEANNIRL